MIENRKVRNLEKSSWVKIKSDSKK